MCPLLLIRIKRACIEFNGECLDTHASMGTVTIRLRRKKISFFFVSFFFLRQTVEEELSLLMFKKKMKIITELLQGT